MEETVEPEYSINPEKEGLDDVTANHSVDDNPIERSPLGGWRKLKIFMIAVRENIVKVTKNGGTKTSNDVAEEDEFMAVWSNLDSIIIPKKLYTEDSASSLSSFNKWLQDTPRSHGPITWPSQSQENTQISRKTAPLGGMASRMTTTVQPRRFNLHSEEKLFPPRKPGENTLSFSSNPPKTTLT